jgi:hypothetical protein
VNNLSNILLKIIIQADAFQKIPNPASPSPAFSINDPFGYSNERLNFSKYPGA